MKGKIEDIYRDGLSKILIAESYSPYQKVKAIFNLLNGILEEITEGEKIIFTTLFSRLAYVANKFKIDSYLMYYLHLFRRDNERMLTKKNSDAYIDLGKYVVENLIDWVWNEKREVDQLPNSIESIFQRKKKNVERFQPIVEVVIESVDIENYALYIYDEIDPTILKTAIFDQADKNEIFNENLEVLSRSFVFPIHANLVDVDILEDGTYIPNAIILEPDYLIDVTTIANCFKGNLTDSTTRIVSKLKSMDNSIPLMVGNIANMFLDEIISNPEIKFKELVPQMFQLSPLSMSVFKDDDIRKMVDSAKNHYLNLKRTVAVDLPKQNVKRKKVFLEPSFYSRDFGIQGRLDLFHFDEENKKMDIVELKSGRPFRANVYGLSASHYTQTLMYDLLIKSTFGYYQKPNNFILYSKLVERSLKYAPPVRSQQYEAMKVRNELIAIEYKMGESANAADDLFSYIKASNFPDIKGFELTDIQTFEKAFKTLSPITKAYFTSFASFISREHRLAKTGEHGLNKSNGLAALWLENMEEKEDRFALLKQLTIKENLSKNSTPRIILQKTDQTNRLANFRSGDIAVLYPFSNYPSAVLKNQIFKCTIISINETEVEVKLRSKQYNDLLFNTFEFWNIEEDSLDSGFNTLYRSLYEFIQCPDNKKQLWMGNAEPANYQINKHEHFEALTNEQNAILDKMSDVKDYFLLWGPPGTGKTSIMLKCLVERLYKSSNEEILLLAYTNRAVDEMCAAIESIGPEFKDRYVRIGSETSCGESFRGRLINNLIKEMKTRDAIKSMVKRSRIFISTVSSIVSKSELFKLKKFDRVIIDEASQILEPMLVGLISRVETVVLIGDHKQLPAVVTQSNDASKIKDKDLIKLGISDMRMSLFERLYHQCKKNDWDHALGLLSYQGRMQEKLMSFPNKSFYEGKLKVLPGLDRLTSNRSLVGSNNIEKILIEERFIYIPTFVDEAFNWKTNKYEAKKVINLLKKYQNIFLQNCIKFDKGKIGVITPYRAQIATIRQELEREIPELVDFVTIDTVERYQGGARDIIILSMCTNRLSQLKSLVSLSHEGIDRKLNVAITRAREQLIIIGNRDILEANETYKKLVGSAYEWKI